MILDKNKTFRESWMLKHKELNFSLKKMQFASCVGFTASKVGVQGRELSDSLIRADNFGQEMASPLLQIFDIFLGDH